MWTYWQCGYVITKSAFDGMRQQDIDSFRQSVLRIVPFLADRVHELRSWNDVKLLTVAVDRLCKPLLNGAVSEADLQAVQGRRLFPRG